MKISKMLIPNFLFIIIVLIMVMIIYKPDGNTLVLVSNFIIVLLALLLMVFGDKYNFSLNKIFMLFVLLFFGVAPLVQYQEKITLWGGNAFTDSQYVYQNFLIIGIIVFYQMVYFIVSNIASNENIKKVSKKHNPNENSMIKRLVIISLVSMIITVVLYRFSLADLLLRSGRIVSMEQSFYLIYSYFVRPLPIVSLVIFKQLKFRNRKIEVFLIVLSLLTNFPTATPRFYTAAMYIPLVILYYKSIQFNYLSFNRIFIFGFMFMFPLLDQFRRIDSLLDIKFNLDFNMFLTEHFDSYQMFMRVITERYVTNGIQLLTSVLFFIPRSIWPGKSIGSGALIAEKLGFSFTNVSMNYFGEGYINFGYIGIIIFLIVLAITNATYDKIYWKKVSVSELSSTFYLFLLGLQFFVLRGDLLSGLAFSSGIFFSIVFVHKILRITFSE